jgi:arginine utilization protein RocB
MLVEKCQGEGLNRPGVADGAQRLRRTHAHVGRLLLAAQNDNERSHSLGILDPAQSLHRMASNKRIPILEGSDQRLNRPPVTDAPQGIYRLPTDQRILG